MITATLSVPICHASSSAVSAIARERERVVEDVLRAQRTDPEQACLDPVAFIFEGQPGTDGHFLDEVLDVPDRRPWASLLRLSSAKNRWRQQRR